MRYFKYKNTNKTRNVALKEQYKSLTEDEKRTVRKEKAWRTFGTLVTIALFSLFLSPGCFLISMIPDPSWWLWKMLIMVGKGIAVFLGAIASGILTGILTTPLWKKVESFNIPLMKKEILSKACAPLREYYGIEEPYIVTKCFDSTEKNFKDHDVCIFVAYNELRIAGDLTNRCFLYGDRDLGCYAFERDEISLSRKEHDGHFALELKAGDTVFLLGYRARSFIKKNFTEIESE